MKSPLRTLFASLPLCALSLALTGCGKTLVTEAAALNGDLPGQAPALIGDGETGLLDFDKNGQLTAEDLGTDGAPAGSFVSAPFPFPGLDQLPIALRRRVMLRFGWEPQAPYGKELVDGSAAEFGYPEGNIDMAKNEVLLHFNESAAPFFDKSGKDHHASCGGSHCPTSIAGKFRTGVQFASGKVLEVSNSTDLMSGAAFTLAVWAKADKLVASSALARKDGAGRGYGIYYTGTNLCAYAGLYGSDRACADYPKATGWNHIAMVLDSGSLKLFINGRMLAQKTVSRTSDNKYPLRIGASNNSGSHPWVGAVDELAVFARALSEDELRGMYRRGYGVKFQLSACAEDGTCDPFRGIGGEEISELHNRAPRAVKPLSMPEINVDDLALVGVTFRFKVTMEYPDSEEGPRLNGVFARGISVP